MNNFSQKELTIILAYYFFDSKKNDSKLFQNFVIKFNSTFKHDYSQQIISYQISLFKGVDASFNASQNESIDSNLINLWNYYIVQDRIDSLKKFYKDFKNNNFVDVTNLNLSEDNDVNEINKAIENNVFTFMTDFPKERYAISNIASKTNMRDAQVSANALKLANYKCECSQEHKTFIRKNCNIPYTEGHHLIPLEFQDGYEFNLDVEANIVSLCSNCHNQLHYGKNPEEILRSIFTEERRKRLEKCGIKITLEQLIELYK